MNPPKDSGLSNRPFVPSLNKAHVFYYCGQFVSAANIRLARVDGRLRVFGPTCFVKHAPALVAYGVASCRPYRVVASCGDCCFSKGGLDGSLSCTVFCFQVRLDYRCAFGRPFVRGGDL